ncbi:MAG: hypothetical protein Q9208_006223 [Pyrenodesmia sp. 3 TL-2023]
MGSIENSEAAPAACGMLETAWQVFGGMSRPLGKEHAEISIICSIAAKVPLTAEQVRRAWRGLGIEYPNLRTVPAEPGKKYVGLEGWVEETFAVEHEVEASLLAQEAKPSDLPRLRWLPSSAEVVLISQHWRIDGIGALMLMGRLMEILAQDEPVQARPPVHPSPVLEDAAQADTFDDLALKDYGVRQAAAFHDVMFKHGNLPYEGDDTTLPGPVGQYSVVLTDTSTDKVVRRCKELGITVTAAVNYALAQMIFALSASGDIDKECRTMISADPRPHLAPPHSSRESACNIYVLGLVGAVRRGSSFEEATASTTQALKSWYTDDFRRSLRWFMSSVSTAAAPTPPSGVYVSNLGRVEQYLKHDYGTLKVDKFRLGTATMTRQMTFHIWTFRDRMVLSLNYNCRYHRLDSVKERLSTIQSELGKGLGFPIEVEQGPVVIDEAPEAQHYEVSART